jgi:peptidoglycan/xylan/chitin deacetylase (PgdA/CDA1 family)
MPSSFLVDNLRNLFRNLRQDGPSAIPHRLAKIAKRKFSRFLEEAAYHTSIGHVLGRAYRGAGITLMFHEIHTNVDAELRTGCDAAQLERIIGALRAGGRDIVTIDEGLQRLADPGSRPFALLTFDDAYRDNLTNALPVLERVNAPITLFTPTGMITRDVYAWWLAIRALILQTDSVDITPMGRRFECADLASKLSTLRQVTSWIGESQAHADNLAPLFAAHGISIPDLVDRYAMTVDEFRQMACHPLVTVGAHTRSHRFLTSLTGEEVLAEFEDNKAYLEALLGRPVNYLAYPYGTPGACGEREAKVAATAGFHASFTTRHGHLFPQHLQHPQLLPRMDAGYTPQSAAALATRLSGLHRAMETGFGDPVAVLA